MSRLLPARAHSVLKDIQGGADCYLSQEGALATAYLERFGRCVPVEPQLVSWLAAKGYLQEARSTRFNEYRFRMTSRGRAALRRTEAQKRLIKLPFTPEQRLLLLVLPISWLLGTAATVFAAEVGLEARAWSSVLGGLAMCLPLILVFAWSRWRGW